MDRAYIGEAYNGATKDWAIVDVPPGTKRVALEGVGGGSEEITWQRYNGVRRSRFIPEGPPLEERSSTRREISVSRREPVIEQKWTEITKDLVVREAIEQMGYEFDETEYFFYIIEYLRYVSLRSAITIPLLSC